MEFYELGSYKETLVRLIQGHSDISRLVSGCFDTSFVPSYMNPQDNIICLDTNVIKADGSALKEVGIDIYLILHKDHCTFSDADRRYFE